MDTNIRLHSATLQIQTTVSIQASWEQKLPGQVSHGDLPHFGILNTPGTCLLQNFETAFSSTVHSLGFQKPII
jgi:hypothetical protein